MNSFDQSLQSLAGWITGTAASVTAFDKTVRAALPVKTSAQTVVVDTTPAQSSFVLDWKVGAAVVIVIVALLFKRSMKA